MPKLPKNISLLRSLRQITRETQSSFAALLGISVSFLQKLELENRAISSQLKRQVFIATGAIFETTDTRLYTLHGVGYSYEFYRLWKAKQDITESELALVQDV